MANISTLAIEDTINYVLQADPTTGVVQKINGDTPENLIVSGFTVNGPFVYTVGSLVNGYVLTIDADGVASWQPSMASGTSGTNGIDGIDGTAGTSGLSYGTSGTSGVGTPGIDGTSGVDGEAGTSGVDGEAGTSGLSYGTSGTSGDTGTSGISGSSGSSGSSGLDGTSGRNGDLYRTISTDTYTLGDVTGTTFTIDTNLGYSVAQRIIIAYDENNFEEAKVLSYDKTTGVLIFDNVSGVVGSGTYSNWVINLAGAAGGNGSSGSSGDQGAAGSSGTSGAAGSSGTSAPGITSGSSGSSGINGPAGQKGTGGTSGTSATAGTSATSGVKGDSGSSGTSATSGAQGDAGSSGSSGNSGTTGTSGNTGTSGTSFTGTQNYTQVLGSQVSNVTTSGISVVSGSITTQGSPVYVQVTGDANPTATGNQWCKLQIYRNATPVGNIIQAEQSGQNLNIPYCVNFIDTPSAGTYTYSMRVVGITGTFQFGEVNGPTLTMVELTGGAGTSGRTGTNGANGSSGSSGNGTAGTSGGPGSSGSSGVSSTAGTSGVKGTSGTSGAGTSGSSGSGTSGISGTNGLSGTHGVSGTSGNAGSGGTSGADTSVLTVVSKTSNYTLVLTDKGNLVELSALSPSTITVPPSSSVNFPIGSQVLLVRGGAAAVSVVAGSGVTIKSANNYLNLNYTNSGATLVKVATDTWYLFGDLKA